MTKRAIRAVKQSIKHWERMVTYARKRDKETHYDYRDMSNDINETTGTEDCALCQYYKESCDDCLLGIKHGACGEERNAYNKVVHAKTWGDFVKAGNHMLRQLKSLLPGK